MQNYTPQQSIKLAWHSLLWGIMMTLSSTDFSWNGRKLHLHPNLTAIYARADFACTECGPPAHALQRLCNSGLFTFQESCTKESSPLPDGQSGLSMPTSFHGRKSKPLSSKTITHETQGSICQSWQISLKIFFKKILKELKAFTLINIH